MNITINSFKKLRFLFDVATGIFTPLKQSDICPSEMYIEIHSLQAGQQKLIGNNNCSVIIIVINGSIDIYINKESGVEQQKLQAGMTQIMTINEPCSLNTQGQAQLLIISIPS